MTIGNLHVLSPADYATQLFNVIAQLEGRKPSAYFDTKGIISIGVGFNIDGAGTASNPNISCFSLTANSSFTKDTHIQFLRLVPSNGHRKNRTRASVLLTSEKQE